MVVLCFAGAIGSGKITLATSVHELMGGAMVSFGDYVRSEAQRQGVEENREGLQSLGATLIVERSWDAFCWDVLSHFHWQTGVNAVIDGVRHEQAVNSLRNIVSPALIVLVFVDINEKERVRRLKSKGLQEKQRLTNVDAHTTESQVHGRLCDIADFHVNGASPTRETASEIVNQIRHQVG